ncbi:MAG: glycogen/starch synthase, partial [Thermodesulfobacteriota bacterium]|nr:glycogen/starch synthase [Thermodesulfobacteriota bacterium]
MAESVKNPRILIVTPEVTYLPERMGSFSNYLTAKAGGLADVSAALIKALFDQGADVHVALPDYRAIFNDRLAPFLNKEQQTIRSVMPDDKIHLAQDRAFYYMNKVYSDYGGENTNLGLAFQREVINNIIPRVKPDLIHCNDWMTGLIPAMSRRMGIPCLFTLHNIHTVKCTLAHIEDKGIDAAYFWDNLYYERMADDYESVRSVNPIDFLVSGVFAAHFVNTVSPAFLDEMIKGRHAFVAPSLMRELANKKAAQCAVGILNTPDPAFNPASDKKLPRCYTPDTHADGKMENKRALQKALGLLQDENAPIFYWPSRLDPVQKGCRLLTDILYDVISKYWDRQVQFVFIADGEYQQHFRDIVRFHQFYDRVAICNFNEYLEHLAYGAADFVLMPSLFEPCGLPQMIGPIYGTLPVAHDTGGIHDTVTPIDTAGNTGNGFLFEIFDSQGLSWAIDQAMDFYQLPARIKNRQIKRIMQQSAALFNHSVTAG